jgi:CBS domain-containing protein
MRVRDLMTAEVVHARPSMSLKDGAALLAANGISGVPVVGDEGTVVGVLSEADILMKAGAVDPRTGLLHWLFEPDPVFEQKLRARTVGDAMTAPAITVDPDVPVHRAAARMVDEGVNRLPVVEGGELVGIVTRADLVRAFARTDAEIAEEIESEVLRRTLWLEPGQVTVDVSDGVVGLTGQVETRTDAELLPLFVRRVPGVIDVKADLTSRDTAGAR